MPLHPLVFHPSATKQTCDAQTSERATREWPLERVVALFDLSFNDLLFQAQQVHRANFDPNEVELATLLSIKTGGCPEDCAYCPQAARYDTGVTAKRYCPSTRYSKLHAKPRQMAPRVSAWVPPGDPRRIVISPM